MATPPVKSEEYGAFVGPIDESSVKRIITGLTPATAPATNIGHLHLLFQSTGGSVSDGICLYNFFKTFPVDLTIYNTGGVQSIAVIAYLGAKKRKTSASATFMLHRTTGPLKAATSSELKVFAQSVLLDDERTDTILRERTKLSKDQWISIERAGLFLSAREAVDAGIANEIGDFAPPVGNYVFNL